MQNKSLHVLFSLLLLVLMSACAGGGGKAIRYYLIDPVVLDRQPVPAQGAPSLSIEVLDLHIPQYLERFQIATRAGKGRLVFSDYHQWGENLRKNLLRTLSRNLSQLLATHDVGTPLNRSASRPDYRVQVYIEQFEMDIDNRVKLVARWQLTRSGKQEPLGVFALQLQGEQTIKDGDYDGMVWVMHKLYGQLSEEVATSILAQEG